MSDLVPVTTMTRDEATTHYNTDGSYYFERKTSRAGAMLAIALQGGRSADPNVSTAMDHAEELQRRLEVLIVMRELPSASEPTMARTVPPADDVKALLSEAGKDARYVKRLLQHGAAMYVSNAPEALRVVRALRPKLASIWSICETMDALLV